MSTSRFSTHNAWLQPLQSRFQGDLYPVLFRKPYGSWIQEYDEVDERMLEFSQPRHCLFKVNRRRFDVSLQGANQRVWAAIWAATEVVEKRGKPHTLWTTRPLPNHSFADCVLFAPKHAKNWMAVFVGLPA